jgi:hypothetical protein
MKSAALSMLAPSLVGADMIAYPGSSKGDGMRIGIIGAGAIGCVVGGLLARAGQDVTLVDQWPEHVDTMRARGLRLSGTCGEHLVPVRAPHPRAAAGGGALRYRVHRGEVL